MTVALIASGLAIAGLKLAAILWSIVMPTHRIWPPRRFWWGTLILVWGPTFALFAILIVLGILGWGGFGIDRWFRYGVGVPIIVVSNLVVWFEVAQFGIAQTSGAKGTLRTDGFYRHSRNPQYVADILMILGWCLISAAPGTAMVGAAATLVLVAAPFAEEGWMHEQYGSKYTAYRSQVRRFL